jgi:hypothetical protein
LRGALDLALSLPADLPLRDAILISAFGVVAFSVIVQGLTAPFAIIDSVSQKWLVRFLQHRIADRRMIHLIQKWLQAGVLEDGVLTVSDTGTGQRFGDLTASCECVPALRVRSLGPPMATMAFSMRAMPDASGAQCAIGWRSSRCHSPGEDAPYSLLKNLSRRDWICDSPCVSRIGWAGGDAGQIPRPRRAVFLYGGAQ